MNRNKSGGKLVTAVVVLLVLVLIGLFLLMGTIVLSNYVDFTENDIPQSSQTEQEQLPEKQPEPEKPVEVVPEEPSSSVQEVIPPVQPQQTQPQNAGSSAAGEQKEPAEPTYQNKTYKTSTSDERKKTFGNISVQAGDIYLAYKTVKGDMTISRDAEGLVELDHCIVEGTLYIKGGQTVVLTDSRIGKIVVKDAYKQETTIYIEGLSRTGEITAYTDLVLDESGLDEQRKGFTELKVSSGNPVVSVSLYSTHLTQASLREECALYLDGGSAIDRLRVEEPSVIDGTGEVTQLMVGCNDITSYIVPEEEKKINSRYDDVVYATHNIDLAAPTGLAVTYDAAAQVYLFGWAAADANATAYEVEMTAQGAMAAKTQTGLSAQVDDAFMNLETTFKVRAVTDKSGYDPSEWAVVTNTPAQTGEIAGFMVTDVAENSLTLGWQAAAHADGYTLTWQQAGQQEATAIHDITGNSYTLEGIDLTEGKAYQFTLQVVGSQQARPAANGTASAAFAVKKLAAPVLTTSYENGLLTYRWDGVEGASSYLVEGASTQYAPVDGGFAASAEVMGAGVYGLSVKAVGGFNQTDGVLYLDGEAAAKNVTASYLNMEAQTHNIVQLVSKSISAQWKAVEHADGYDVVLARNGLELAKVQAVVNSYTYVAPTGQTLLADGADYAITVSVKAPQYVANSEQLYLKGSAVVASASVKAEHGIVAEGEGKTGLAVPVDKGAALTVANLTVSDKYNYSLKLVVDGTVVKTLPYTLQENGTAAVTLGQLMADVLTELPAAYTVELTAEDKNPADAAVYLGKTIAVLTVAA